MRNQNLEEEFKRIKINSKVYLRLLIDSIDSAIRSINNNELENTIRYTWDSLVYLVQYLSSKYVDELYNRINKRIISWLMKRGITLPLNEVLDTIIIPRAHRHLRPRARDLEEVVKEVKGLYELVLHAEALYITLNEGYEDEEEIKELVRQILHRLLIYMNALRIISHKNIA